MKFSLRTLLAIAMLSGLAFAFYGSQAELIAKQAQHEQLRKTVETLNTQYRVLIPGSPDLKQHRQEEFASLRQQREIAIDAVAEIQERYSEITPRPEGVLSLRTIPQLRLPGQNPKVRFRVRIPDSRPIWLKYGVVNQRRSVHDVKTLENVPIEGFDTGGYFQHAGPFGVKLSPGFHLIDVSVGNIVSDKLTITVSLDDDKLLESTLSAPLLDSAGSSHISGREQVDFNRKRGTPWLISYNFDFKDPFTQSETELDHRFTMWLAESKGISTEFPKKP